MAVPGCALLGAILAGLIRYLNNPPHSTWFSDICTLLLGFMIASVLSILFESLYGTQTWKDTR